MAEWATATVESCLERVAFGRATKILARDYRPSGSYPIIDQGKGLIAGWTDDDSGLISADLPIVVFGDHTRAFKYVDFPFVRGADGTQLLKPKVGIDPLFFYYACKAIDLPNRGYNRHFKSLREREIPTPPLPEQRDIAQALRRIDDALSVQDKQFRAITDTKRTAVQLLFTRGPRGEPQKETEIGPMPASWEPRTILDLCTIWSGGTPPKSVPEYWGGDIPWVSGKDLKSPSLDDAKDHITARGADVGSSIAPANAVLLLVRGMGLAKDLPVAVVNRPMAFNQDIKALVSRGAYSGKFLRSAIYTGKDRLLSQVVSSAHGTMTLKLDDVENLKVPCPPDPTEAQDIVAVIESIEYKVVLHRRKHAVLGNLFEALLHKLVTGEIRVGALDLSALTGAATDA